jgi:hypothetical protein
MPLRSAALLWMGTHKRSSQIEISVIRERSLTVAIGCDIYLLHFLQFDTVDIYVESPWVFVRELRANEIIVHYFY